MARYREIEPLLKDVIRVREKELGAEHPDTLASRSFLADAVQMQGKNAEGEAEHRTVLSIRERVLGAEHPDTLQSRIHLAITLQLRDKYAEAEAEYRAVLSIRERVLGAEHPDTLESRSSLALVLKHQGKNEQAIVEMAKAEAGLRKVLGEAHPFTKFAKRSPDEWRAEASGESKPQVNRLAADGSFRSWHGRLARVPVLSLPRVGAGRSCLPLGTMRRVGNPPSPGQYLNFPVTVTPEDQVHIFLGDMNIEKKDDAMMTALKDSKMNVPDFGPTNMRGNRWFDQMAGKAGRKTRLLRHGKFDWRHAVFGPHPDPTEVVPALTAEEILAHYEKKVEKVREDSGKGAVCGLGKGV